VCHHLARALPARTAFLGLRAIQIFFGITLSILHIATPGKGDLPWDLASVQPDFDSLEEGNQAFGLGAYHGMEDN
jgi:hypothetical protein